MYPERAEELVIRKIEKYSPISLTQLVISFGGRIRGIRQIVGELQMKAKVKTEWIKNEHGPKTLLIKIVKPDTRPLV